MAQQLFFTKGYEQTSVKEIITEVGVAKGTFYHYFDSKVDILDAVVKRIYQGTLATLQPMIASDELNALEKLQSFFGDIQQWKVSNKDIVLKTMEMLYRDDNVLLREKLYTEAKQMTLPELAKIIQQGIDEGRFNVQYPYEIAELIMIIPRNLSEFLISLLLKKAYGEADIAQAKRQIRVCNEGIARLLGMPDDAITLMEPSIIDDWLY